MDDDKKRIEQAEYRTKLVEAELNAIRGSKAYKLSKMLGIIKSQVKSDPVGLSKKAARMIFTNPQKARHMLRSANRGAFILQSVAEQTAKYQEWILLNEPDESELDNQRTVADNLKYRPLISIVTPVFNPPLQVFEDLIESVLEQTYTNFELCLGNFGDDAEVAAMIARYAQLDPRVKEYTFSENKGIAYNSNQILEKVSGEFIALLDHDDTLSPDALYENALLLNDKPYDFIYSDKDKIDEKGNRFDPLFKAELSPEMLLNVNYLTHLNLMRTALVRRIGGWDPVTDGAQDWDLFLRVISEAKYVGFIPKVLYHWRVIATSTAMSIETKPYALANQCKAVDKYLAVNNIPAHAYVERTELFLSWDKPALDPSPLIFLYHSNQANTQRIVRRVRKILDTPTFVLLVEDAAETTAARLSELTGFDVLTYQPQTVMRTLDGYFKAHKKVTARNALFILDTIRLPKSDDWYEKLTGWLSIKDVAASSGRLVDRQDLIINSGGLVTKNNQYFPLFFKYPRYYQSYIGNAEWVRNLSIISSVFCATDLTMLKTYAELDGKNHTADFDNYFLWLTSGNKRLVLAPHATAMAFTEHGADVAHDIAGLTKAKDYTDPFGNPNMAPNDPLRLFDNEILPGLAGQQETGPIDLYQHDAAILSDTFDITEAEFDANRSLLKKPVSAKPQSVAWFLPGFDGVYAGLMNIFSFANYLHVEKGFRTTVYLLKAGSDVSQERDAVIKVFPALQAASFVTVTPAEASKIKQHDIGIATQWSTTYPLAKTQQIARKFYFIQDNEVNFYPKGSISALVELSYRFGFTAIAGTEGLLDMYRSQYGGDGVVMKSKVDLTAYHPRKDVHYTPKAPYKVFFYARPNMPRNAFELGIAGLKRLKQDLGENVEIITAGAAWDPAAYGVQGMFNNLGKIEYAAVPKLYRSVDAGLMFMFSGHPGVTASELMASGCPVVVNEYDDVTWQELYEHEKTCLITLPTASEVAHNLQRCLTDKKLRKLIIEGGIAKASEFYDGYDEALDDAFKAITRSM